MKYVLVLLALLYSTKAYAQSCYIPTLFNQQMAEYGYSTAERGLVNGIPSFIYVHQSGNWKIVTQNTPLMWCVIAFGDHYKSLKWRKA